MRNTRPFFSTRDPKFGPVLEGTGRLYMQNTEVKIMN
jgi:hypothetical protein